MFNLNNLQWANIRRIKKRYEMDLFLMKNVQAVGCGMKIRKGKETNEKCIIVFVDEKLPDNLLLAEEKVPKKIGGLFGCKTDVVSIGEPEELSVHRQRHRPVRGGISCSHATLVTAGTFGSVVYDEGKPCVLSNAHVIAPHYQGAKIGDIITQPGRVDRPHAERANLERDRIGVVKKYVEIKPLPYKDNLVDCALGSLEINYSNEQLGLPKTETKIVRAKIGDVVVKSSRTSGVLENRVIATDVIAKVRFQWGGEKRVIWFSNQIFLSQNPPFTFGGDSGSCLFAKRNEKLYPCGLIFAGSEKIGIANQMDNVQRLMGFTFEPEKIQEEGYVAIGRHLNINQLEITTRSRTNLREEPGLSGRIVKVLPKGTRLEIIEGGKIADNFLWVKVRLN